MVRQISGKVCGPAICPNLYDVRSISRISDETFFGPGISAATSIEPELTFTLSRMHYQTILQQYDLAGRPQLFDDAYFDAIAKRRDDRHSHYMKLISFNVIVMLLLGLAAFGIKPKYEFQGLALEIDRIKELLLFLSTCVAFVCVMERNDLVMLREVLRARLIRRQNEYPEVSWPLMRSMAFNTYDLRYMDILMDHTMIHIDDLEEAQPPGIRVRATLLRRLLIGLSWCFRISFMGIQAAILYDIAMAPSFHWAVSWTVVALSVATSLLSYLTTLPYLAPRVEAKPPPQGKSLVGPS